VWLFGSIHVLPKDTNWRTPEFDDILARAEQVYFEADIGPLGQITLVINSIRMGFAAKTEWLATLSTEQQMKLEAAVTPLGLSVEQLAGYQPWLAEAMVEEKLIETLGYSPSLGVDPVLQGELPKEKKAYFETVGEQMALLGAHPLDKQVQRLMVTVDGIADLPKQMADMTAAWVAGDTEALGKQIEDDPTMDESFTQALVLDRNGNWLKSIEGLLADNHQDLIVVGAGHLAGDGSLVDLLGQAGFTVKRIQ
jgi:uncharacterized protein YbaP (TraB family)